MGRKQPEVIELFDIFKRGSICAKPGEKLIDDVVAEIIEKELHSRRIIGPEGSVVIPAGALASFDCENGTYQVEFEVFKGHDKIVGRGIAYGSIMCYPPKAKDPCEQIAELLDMTIELEKQ